jgi:hypothetical protein
MRAATGKPGQITVAYVDDDGNIPRTETIA